MKYTGLGIQFVLVFMLFLAAGIWVDREVGAAIPWFTLLGTLIGGSVAFYVLYVEVFVRGRDDGEGNDG